MIYSERWRIRHAQAFWPEYFERAPAYSVDRIDRLGAALMRAGRGSVAVDLEWSWPGPLDNTPGDDDPRVATDRGPAMRRHLIRFAAEAAGENET